MMCKFSVLCQDHDDECVEEYEVTCQILVSQELFITYI